MAMKDNVNLGQCKITIYNKTTGKVDYEKSNIVTIDGLGLYADRLINNNVGYLDYFLIGDGSVTHDETSSSLDNQIFNKQLENKSATGSKVSVNLNILGQEAVGSWTEIGLSEQGTGGVLTNVVNVTYTHNQGEELLITWEINLNR